MSRADFWFIIGTMEFGFYSINNKPLWAVGAILASVLFIYFEFVKRTNKESK